MKGFLGVLALLILPGAGVIYFAFAEMFDLENSTPVLGCLLIAALIAGLLLLAGPDRYDGTLNKEETEKKITWMLEMNSDPESLDHKKSVTFKINS